MKISRTTARAAHILGSILAIVTLTLAATSFVHAEEAKDLPVRIYVLFGQSNMEGKGSIEGKGSNTLRYLVDHDPNKQFQFLVGKDGKWRDRPDVWIYYNSNPADIRYGNLKPGYGSSSGQIGPELGFGEVIGDAYKGQVLLIKTAWGGKSLGNDFLPPSVDKYPTPDRPGDPGYYYCLALRDIKEVTQNIKTYFPDYHNQGIEIAGLAFHQGWNDQYGGLDQKYEKNMAAFIHDIRSLKYGLGVPKLPIVIATSGNIRGKSLIKQGQLAMGDTKKYPQFAGNVAVVDTDKPYGPEKMPFKFVPENEVGFHWNHNAHTYLNIGRAMADQMLKLDKPAMPARLRAVGTPEGVRLTWQLGSETPKDVTLLRNGKKLDADLAATQITFIDKTALPGKNSYQIVLDMPSSGKFKLSTDCDTSVSKIKAYRGMEGVNLSWKARGKYKGFRILRDGKVIADSIAGDTRSYLDKKAPAKGKVVYTIEPNTGKATPAKLTVNLGPADPGDALVYEPFDYPADADKPQSLIGKGGATGTEGTYFLIGTKTDLAPASIGGGLSYGDLPVTGNRGSTHRWSQGCAIKLDDSLRKAGLLKDGATLWISYVFRAGDKYPHRQGGGTVTLRSKDLKEGVGFTAGGRQYETVVVVDGKMKTRRITSIPPLTSILVVGKIVWGKDGANDSFVPYRPKHNLKQPEKPGRPSVPFNIDQKKLSLLVLQGEGQFDEIRVGPTYESVIGRGGTQDKK